MEELKDLIISKDITQKMSVSEMEELDDQYGWFADDTKEFEDLGMCPYDSLDISVYDGSLRLHTTHNEWKYFLPVKNLQRYLKMLVGMREVQKTTEILGVRDEFLRNI